MDSPRTRRTPWTALLDRLERLWDRVSPRTLQWTALVTGWAILAVVFVTHARAASMVVDGVRWFWLNDDQMISMRYAHNLVQGHGLVWNPGERVEGYTNPLWTLIMAAIHLLPLSVQKTSVAVQVVNFALCSFVIWQALRLLRIITPEPPRVAAIAVALVIATCWNVVFWATSGFETALLAALNLVFLTELLGKGGSWIGWVALATIPVTRGDGLHIWGGNAVLAMLLSERRAHTARILALTLLPTAAHFGFRRLYYGEWLPNTYYLKAMGLPDKHARGFKYAHNFLVEYAVPCCLALAAALSTLVGRRASAGPRRGQGLALLACIGGTWVYCIVVGGDSFAGFRFFAHALPVLFVFAAACAELLAKGALGRGAVLGALCVSSVPLINPLQTLTQPGHNGDPFQQIPAAALLNKNALPTSSIAVIPAGMVPYYTGLRAYDALGKADKHVARLPYHRNALIAHGKLDPAYTLGQKPDFVISCRSHSVAANARHRIDRAKFDYVLALLASDEFREHYLPNRVKDPFLANHTQIYAHSESPEAERLDWTGVRLGGN